MVSNYVALLDRRFRGKLDAEADKHIGYALEGAQRMRGLIRDLLEAFVGDKKRFDQPVSVRVTDEVRTLGFVTQDDLSLLAMPGHVAVYLPFSYSMAGTVIVVPRSRVEKLSIASSALMAFVVSGGVSSS